MRLPAAPPAWFIRPLWWWQQRRHGAVLEPTALWSWRPAALLGFLGLFGLLRRTRSPLPMRLRALASVRVSQVVDCAFCIDLNAAALRATQDMPVLEQVSRWRASEAFTADERLALEYAEAISATPPTVSDDLMARLRSSFTPQAIVELTAVVALQNMSARFNNALDAQAHGFCQRPAQDARA
ncbi:MAG: carboxymuconolactone decarboxylase family protein [Rubrivivax sp.]|nr:carboxymuconolactone decarboxylase family protein [Rubrivivax sp.]